MIFTKLSRVFIWLNAKEAILCFPFYKERKILEPWGIYGNAETFYLEFEKYLIWWVSLAVQTVKNWSVMQETLVQSLGQDNTLEKKWQLTPVFLSGES